MNAREWEIFEAVLRHGSMTRAAQELAISQPAISQALRHLQERTGLRFFERDRGRLVATPEATFLSPRVADLINQLRAVESVASDLRREWTGLISLACIPTLSVSLMPKAIARFCSGKPDLQVRLEVCSSAQATDRVGAGTVDLAIVHAIAANADVAVITRTTAAMIGVLRLDHPLAGVPHLSPDLLEDSAVITGRHALGSAVNASFARLGRVRRGRIDVNHSLAACAMAAEGLGVALVDPFVNFRAFADLVAKPFLPAIALETYVVAPRGRRASPLALGLVDVLTELLDLAEGPSPPDQRAHA